VFPFAVVSLYVVLNTLVRLSFTDVFMRRFPCCVVSLVGVMADTFVFVLSITMLRFSDMFVLSLVFVVFTLML